MEKTVQAVYEGGVLRPLEPIPLEDRQEVTVTISDEGHTPGDHPLLASPVERASAPTTTSAWMKSEKRYQQFAARFPKPLLTNAEIDIAGIFFSTPSRPLDPKTITMPKRLQAICASSSQLLLDRANGTAPKGSFGFKTQSAPN